MKPRYQISQTSDRFRINTPNFYPDNNSECPENEIPVSELNRFTLACIEKLVVPTTDATGKAPSVHDTIAEQMLQNLPTYMKVKVTLAATEKECEAGLLWSCPLQMIAAELRDQILRMQELITRHLIQMGEDMGLPEQPLNTLARVTQIVLARYAA